VKNTRADGLSVGTLGRFDVVLTSPPYGDSRTTVQYGAMSGICLDIVSRLHGLDALYAPGRDIDSSCLGGRKSQETLSNMKKFWAGAPTGDGGKRVSAFLSDFARTCGQIANVIEPGGHMAMVVGRRCVDGFRVKLDDFAIAEMEARAFTTQKVERRRLRQKTLPRTINRFARAACPTLRETGKTITMSEEIIVTFRAPTLAFETLVRHG
jgi:site-specific DNA-methyltransferase (cytosine-N4-specific)